jgi:hypothetical protein
MVKLPRVALVIRSIFSAHAKYIVSRYSPNPIVKHEFSPRLLLIKADYWAKFSVLNSLFLSLHLSKWVYKHPNFVTALHTKLPKQLSQTIMIRENHDL